MKDILTNWAKDNQLKMTSPVIGAFISAWILFNWDRFLLLFWGEGELPIRLKQFQDTTNISDYQFWLWPLLVALIYVFGLPYLNILTQKTKRHAELLRHNEVVDTDITKEIKLAKLNEEKYKSNPNNDYLGQKIKYELEQKEAEAKKAEAEVEKKQSEAEILAAEAKEAASRAEQESSKEKTAKLELEKQQRSAEKEKHSHELTKSRHINELATLRFPTAYQYIYRLSEDLAELGYILKLDTLANVIAITFGYSNAEKLITDNNFTQATLSDLSFVVYDSSDFINQLESILDKDGSEVIDESELFDFVIQVFETIDHCKLIPSDSLKEEAVSYIEENGFEILELDQVNSEMAATNAIFDEINEFVVNDMNFDAKNNTCSVNMSGSVSGTNQEDKMFSGDTIDVQFTLSYKPLIGANGFGSPEYIEVRAEAAHPDDHSYR
ncbi:hypothetical protein [uncultured Paraglaciecola sp.]|uniref:hypothetical protein n=1 Tax=uncultured Paraglaciecola sp. TaxID=1765024 RepID=UPI0030DDCF1F|tara:strand:- start:98751 stop:100067 length:1317 start_codon:yes stop_codon:yes gene_type:complete